MSRDEPNIRGLTLAEVRAARMVAAGRSDAEVARALALSRAAVRAHVQRACNALGVSTRAELAMLFAPGDEP